MLAPVELPSALNLLHACADAREWAARRKDLRRAYRACPRGDWLLWLAARLGVDRRLVVQAACDCARTALPYVRAGEDRPRLAIEAAEAWCRGEATGEQVRASAAAASAAYDAAASYAAAAAAAHAAYAASAAAAAAHAAAAAAYDAAASYAADAAGVTRLAECADLVRRRIPYDVMLAAWSASLPREEG